MTFETMDRLIKLGSEVLLLYGFYLKTYHIQNINPVYCNNKFVGKGLDWSKNTVTKYRKILILNGFITVFKKRNAKSGTFKKEYVMLNYVVHLPDHKLLGSGMWLGSKRLTEHSVIISTICLWCMANDMMYNRFPISREVVNLGSNTILTNNINTKLTKKKKVFSEDSVEIKISKYLFERIKLFNPQHKEPNFQQWAQYVDKILRIDHRTKKDIWRVIDFATEDEFWQANILSTNKLRIQFDKLLIKINANQQRLLNEKKEKEDANPYSHLKTFSEIDET